MSPATVAFILQVISWIPTVTSGIKDVVEFVQWGSGKINEMIEEGRNPTDEEWDELNRRTAKLRRLLHSDSE